MTTVVCLTCEQYIERSNHGFAGYCSPQCRDRDHAEREARKHRPKESPE